MYDLIIIGGGPGGYTAALESVKLNKKVLIIEKKDIGGVCLNRGCIPTKSLLNSGKLYKKSKASSKLGIDYSDISFNFKNAVSWKEKSVVELKSSLEYLIKQKGIDVIKGVASVINSNEVKVNDVIYKTHFILIATGSKPIIPKIPGIDSEYVLTSSDILDLKEKPKSITIIGGGVIGVEFASFFNSIEVEVNLIELQKSILPTMDIRLGKVLRKSLKVNYYLNTEVKSIDKNCVTFLQNGVEDNITSDVILLAVGRKPNTSLGNSIGLESVGYIEVDKYMQTSIKNIYAVGDCTAKTFLAHGATKMAEIAVFNMFSSRSTLREMNFKLIPSVIYSEPEVASIGLTSNEAKNLDLKIIKSSYYLKSNGRYLVENGDENGICIVIADFTSRAILGVHIVGTSVSEIISLGTIAIQEKFTLEKFSELIFPHPTLSETIKETIFFNN